ncbi:MAG TPA: PSD1 and planctomycete cytochrome C domain-containing protein [Verrucomicrobiae bacterium]|nr:PSD1 and planctomycete cytochrome C domain-containing protein [Verrucomicrobiae bacterium]
MNRVFVFSRCVLFVLAGLFLPLASALAASPASADKPDAAGLEFFEKHIRPVLIDNCYACHSAGAEKLKGSLYLDTRAGLLKGGDTGPAIVPGNPEKSLLIRAVRYTDKDLKMPPKDKKLTDEQIEHLEMWVKMGAPDPRTGQAAKPPGIEPKKHWAFQPVREPAIPTVKGRKLVRTPVDAFLLSRLEEKKLSFTAMADKRTLIRRATFDLHGLPPTPEEVRSFEADDSAEAFARLVDRLLASPRYGERWARYWLDIARYADTKGYVFEEERRYPFSFTYRDYVIRAFNEDLPYDRFLIEQLAADHLGLGEDKRALAGMGFLTLGRRFLNNQADIIDDRLDVVGRGTMGLTIACARCHDHKFDPISMKDYYGLYGVFASSSEPGDKPLLGGTSLPKEYPEYQTERKKREEELSAFRKQKEGEVLTKVRGQVGDYLLALHDSDASGDEKKENLVRERKLQPSLARRYREASRNWSAPGNPIFGPWFALTKLERTNFAAGARELSGRFRGGRDGSNEINRAVARMFDPEKPPESLKEAAEGYNKLFAEVDKEWREARTNSAAVNALPDPSREALRQVLYGKDSPIMALDGGDLTRFMDTPAQQKMRALRRKVDELDATHPGVPPRAMSLVDNATPSRPHIFRRGNPNNPGDEVPRAFLEVLSGPERKPFTKGSGRLEMAEAIASKDNPLTARVWVNRVWTYHLGTPLVRTPSDFGLRSEPPANPALLDYLAARFMAGGWSTKNIHRLIMLSSAYQQGNAENAKAVKADPSNSLYWRQNRRRLDFEAMRDTLLALSGRLDLTMGGRPIDITRDDAPPRRTVYAFVERQNLPGIFRTFDFASPDTTSPQRFTTTVPQQALFLMNSPFVVQQATNLLLRPDVASVTGDNSRIARLYEVAFQRTPDAEEMALARAFLATQSDAESAPESPVWTYGFGKFEENKQQVENFTPLPHWTGYAWQGGEKLPDAKLGWVILNGDGGHVGNDQNHAAIRRWLAPRDGVVSIEGELNHPSEKGDGVRGRVVSSRIGLLGVWTAQNGKVATPLEGVEVRKGDTLDFVADCRHSVEFDSFHWSPVVKMTVEQRVKNPDTITEWNAKADFSGPPKPSPRRPLNAWEKLAQVMLLANETIFVD